jgi:hypothetical protein
MENITVLGGLWQDEIMNLYETTPESLDTLDTIVPNVSTQNIH